MNFLRALIASLLSLICSLTVITFVILTTLQTTILDRNQTKTWIQDSGVYQTALTTAIDSDPTTQQQIENTPVPLDALKTALNKTFPPSYVQNSSEKIIDSTYNWLDGQTSTVTFEINATSKKSNFVTNLAELLEPQIAALPRCASIAAFNASNPTCIPPGYTARQLADSLAIDAANSISVFNQPLTNKNLGDAQQSDQTSAAAEVTNADTQKIPEIITAMRAWVWLLPVIAILSGGLMVLLSQHRLIATKGLAGRLTCSLILALILGIVGATLGKSLQASDYFGNNPALKNILEPILRQAIPAIGLRLAWISGILALATGTLWTILRAHHRTSLLKSSVDRSSVDTPPSKPNNENHDTQPLG